MLAGVLSTWKDGCGRQRSELTCMLERPKREPMDVLGSKPTCVSGRLKRELSKCSIMSLVNPTFFVSAAQSNTVPPGKMNERQPTGTQK